jgi:hypothetical protein
MSPSRGTNRAFRHTAIAILLAVVMMSAFAQAGAPATAAHQSQTTAQGTSTKSGGAKAASKNATAQSNASTNSQSANQENNSPNTGSNNPGIAPAGWVPQAQNQQMKAGNRTTIPNQKGSKPAAKPDSKENKPANDGIH